MLQWHIVKFLVGVDARTVMYTVRASIFQNVYILFPKRLKKPSLRGAYFVDPALWTLLCGPCFVGPALWTLLCGPCLVDPALWTLLCGPCLVDPALWTLLLWTLLCGTCFVDPA